MKIKDSSFIEFLALATPEEVSDLIKREGKQKKPICPIIFDIDTANNNNDDKAK